MDTLRRWLSEGLAPREVNSAGYRRMVNVLTVGRLLVLVAAIVAVFALGEEFRRGPYAFIGAVVLIYVPFIALHYWVSLRSAVGPGIRAAVLAGDVGVVAIFTWLFPELRILGPYGYLLIVAFTTAMGGLATGLIGSVLAVGGSFLAWPAELAGAPHRIAFVALLFAMAVLIDGIGRERNEAARLAKEKEERLAEAQALAHVGSWHWDLVHDRVSCSEELFRIFGYDRTDLVGSFEDVLDHVHPEDRERVEGNLTDAIATSDEFSYENRILHTSGETRVVQTRGRVIRDAGGRPVEALGTGRDVTAERRSEDAMRDALAREREASERLRSLNDMKDAFLTAVSHELRTPLTAVLGFAHTLEATPHVGDDRHMLRRLVHNAEKLERLLSDLLDIDRLERGILRPRRRPTDVAELARTAADETVPQDRPLTLDLQPLILPVDPGMVERIVENLLANAVKHTPAGTPIWVRVHPHPDGALLIVEDAGPGVPPQLREDVFQPFRRGRPSAHSPGVGIGLSLVARFAELHGGRAWATEREGGGASFHVLIGSGAEPPSTDVEISSPLYGPAEIDR